MFAKSRRAGLVAGLALLSTATCAGLAWAAAPAPILTTLAHEGRFTDFLHAVNTAGLAGTLHGPGPLTVFAPNNDAFAKLPSAQRDEIMSNPSELKRLIRFDIVPTRLTASELNRKTRSQTPSTLEGDPLRVASAVGVTTVNGAPIVKQDIPAKNGIIQEVGSVIMPPTEITAPPGKYVPPPAPRPAPAQVRPPVPTAPPAPAPAAPTNPSAPRPNPAAPTTLPMIPANPPGAPGSPGAPGTTPTNPPATYLPPTPTNPPANSPAPTSPPANSPGPPTNPPQSNSTPPASTTAPSAPPQGTPAPNSLPGQSQNAPPASNTQNGAPSNQQPASIPGENAP